MSEDKLEVVRYMSVHDLRLHPGEKDALAWAVLEIERMRAQATGAPLTQKTPDEPATSGVGHVELDKTSLTEHGAGNADVPSGVSDSLHHEAEAKADTSVEGSGHAELDPLPESIRRHGSKWPKQ